MDTHYAWVVQRRQERKIAGLCVVCGGPKDREGWHCSKCLDYNNGLKKTIRERHLIEGLCATCLSPLDREGWFCSACLKKSNAHARERTKYRKENGLCPQCGNKADDGYVFCQRCRDLKADWVKNKRAGIKLISSRGKKRG
jgi:hypothetical protein